MDLERLTCHEKYNIADDPNMAPEALARLSLCEDSGVRRRVLVNPNTPQHIKECLLEILPLSEKLLIARIPYTPPEILDRLADDGYSYSVAENQNTSPETLARLADDVNISVRCYVAQNPNTPKHIKEYLTAIDFWRKCCGP